MMSALLKYVQQNQKNLPNFEKIESAYGKKKDFNTSKRHHSKNLKKLIDFILKNEPYTRNHYFDVDLKS